MCVWWRTSSLYPNHHLGGRVFWLWPGRPVDSTHTHTPNTHRQWDTDAYSRHTHSPHTCSQKRVCMCTCVSLRDCMCSVHACTCSLCVCVCARMVKRQDTMNVFLQFPWLNFTCQHWTLLSHLLSSSPLPPSLKAASQMAPHWTLLREHTSLAGSSLCDSTDTLNFT